MGKSTKIYFLLAILVLGAIALTLQFVSVRQVGSEKSSYTTNSGELVQGAIVGQTIVASDDKLSGVSVMFATYSGRNNTSSVEFHLRRSVNDTTDLRLVKIPASELGDNQLYTFKFAPIENSFGQTYFFFVTSPDGTHGNAVTVDLDTRDPYHLGTAYIAHVPQGAKLDPVLLQRSGKQTIDVVFQTYNTVPLRQAIVDTVRDSVYVFVNTWDKRRGDYYLWGKLAAATLVFISLLVVSHKYGQLNPLSPKVFHLIFLAIMAVALLLRLMYAINMPLTSDEGNYLYDAHSLLQGHLAGGDGYVKAPLFIGWVALWQFLLGNTIFAGRLSSVVAGVLIMIPIYLIAREMNNKYTGLLAAAAWGLFGGAVVSNIYVHTQIVALFFGIYGVAVAWMAVRGHIGKRDDYKRDGDPSSLWWFFWSGILLGLGVASRKSILALGLVPLMIVLVETKSWAARIKQLLAIGIGFSLVIFALLVAAQTVYGPQGVWEITGLNSAEDASNVEASQADQIREYSIKGMTPFFRESLPMILLSVLAWGIMLEEVVWTVTKRLFTTPPSFWMAIAFRYVVPKLGWFLPALAFMWVRGFFFEYEGSLFLDMGGMKMLWACFVIVIAVVALWPRPKSDTFDLTKYTSKHSFFKAAVPLNVPVFKDNSDTYVASFASTNLAQKITVSMVSFLWLAGLTFFYINWIKFHANYIIEFLPPLAIASGVGAYLVYKRFLEADVSIIKPIRWVVSAGFVIVLCWAIYLSGYITYVHEHTGTFNLGSTQQAADWAKQNIPMDQSIFTGAAVVPYLSGHHVTLDIAHPRWYAYQFTRDNPDRIKTFLPTPDEMVEAYRKAQWFMMDSQTGFSFLMEYTEIEAGLEKDWVQVQGIENGSNTLTFYRRVK